MPSSKVVREAVVQIVSKGFAAVSGTLSTLQGRVSKFNKDMLAAAGSAFGKIGVAADLARKRLDDFSAKTQGLSSVASRTFAATSAGILGLVAAADPVRFSLFTQLIRVAAIQIGTAFIPLLNGAIDGLLNLNDWLSRNSETILPLVERVGRWALILSGATAGGFAAVKMLSTLAGAVSGAVTAFQMLFGVVRAVAAVIGVGLGPITAVVAVVGLISAAVATLVGRGNTLAGFGKIWDGIKSAVGRFWGFVQPILAAVWERIQALAAGIMDRLQPVWDRVSEAFGRMWAAVQPALAMLWGWVERIGGYLADTMATGVTKVFGWMADGVAMAAEGMAKLVEYLGPVLSGAVGIAQRGFDFFLRFVTSGINLLIRGINLMIDGINLAIRGMNKLNPLFKVPELGKLSTVAAPQFGGDKAAPKPDEKKPDTPAPQPEPKKPGRVPDRYRPLMEPGKVEFSGVEDVFRKAQAAVNQANDPNNMANLYRQQLAQGREGNDLLRQTVENTRGRQPASFN